MRSVAHREIALSSIVVSGSFRSWCEAHADEIAKIRESRKALLLAHVPVVEAVTMKLVAGQRRLAALMADGVKRHVVHLVEGTPAELRRLAAVENLHRGHSDDLGELTRAYVDGIEAEVEQERAGERCECGHLRSQHNGIDGVELECSVLDAGSGRGCECSAFELPPDSPRKPGRPKTARGEARARAAADAGTTPEAIRKREARAEAKEAEPTQDDEHEVLPPPIDMLGVGAQRGWLQRVRDAANHIAAIDQQLRQLQGQARYLPQPHQQRLYAALHDAAAIARALKPEVVCAICRDPDGSKGKRKGCLSCAGLGWLTAEGKKGLHPSVLAAPAGGWPAPKAPPAKAPEKRMRIEDGAGREPTVEREPGEDDGLAF